MISTLTVLSTIYGLKSLQVAEFQARVKQAKDEHSPMYESRLSRDICAALDSAIADAKAGLHRSQRLSRQGEVLGDFMAMARTALEAGTNEAEKVAALLVAAALEELLKKIGERHGLDIYDRDYRGVIQKLKDAEVLVGPQAANAHGFSTFRDKAMHAQFDQIERPTIQSALSFAEGLAQKHFA